MNLVPLVMIPISLSVSIVFGENIEWFFPVLKLDAVTPWWIGGYGNVSGGRCILGLLREVTSEF
jgi:hypothetical protein